MQPISSASPVMSSTSSSSPVPSIAASSSASLRNPRAADYPEKMIEIFKLCHSSIDQLPVLDLGDRRGTTGYIDFLKPEDMTHPIMKFQDCLNRPGIAFHVEGHAENVTHHIYGAEINIRDVSGVLAVFKRYTDHGPWRVGMGGQLNLSMLQVHDQWHNNNGHVGAPFDHCPTCPDGMTSGDSVNYETLYKLLSGNDPLFKIGMGYVPPTNPQPMSSSRVFNPITIFGRTITGRTIAVAALAFLAIGLSASYYFLSKDPAYSPRNILNGPLQTIKKILGLFEAKKPDIGA